MYISKEELKTHLYDYQVEQISEGDDSVVTAAIDTGVAEVKSYLANRYDVETIFAAEGDQRSSLVVEAVKVCAVWHLLMLSNVDAEYERYEKAYERTISYLKEVAEGLLTPDLPYKETADGSPAGTIQIASQTKFQHHI